MQHCLCSLLLVCHCLCVAATPAPSSGRAQCLLIGAIGVRWRPVEGATGYIVYRSNEDERWSKLAETSAAEYVDRTELERDRAYFYAVSARQGDDESDRRVLGMALNGANLVAGGDFEVEPIGGKTARCFASISNGQGRMEIVEGSRPGGAGTKILKVTGDATEPIIRLHTPHYWALPGAEYRVLAWCKAEAQGAARLGGQVLNAEGKKSAHRRVAYFQSRTIEEGAEGWELMKGNVDTLPKDAATIQLWALAWKTRGVGYFDDLQIIDQRIVELAEYDLEAAIRDVREALPKVTSADELVARGEAALREGETLRAKVADTKLGIDELLEASRELARAQKQLEDVRWDLKILGLRSEAGGGAQ